MYTIKFYVNTFGKYKVPHTADFGFDVTIQLNGNARKFVNMKDMTITYDPRYANLKQDDKGRWVLQIIDEETLKQQYKKF